MKVLHVIFSFTSGGSENMLIDILNEQTNYCNPSLLVINNIFDENLLNRISPLVSVILLKREPGVFSLSSLIKFNSILYKIKPDVIHCHNNNIAPFIFPLFYYKTVVTVHDTGTNIFFLRLYKKIFAISQSVKIDILKRSNVIKDCFVISNGIQVSKLNKEKKPKDKFSIVQIGRLVHEKKGNDIVLFAIKDIPNVVVDFIGDGSSFDYLTQLTYELKLEDRVNFLGEKSREYIYENLCNYDLLIQPSNFEGFGLTIVEAMVAKVPVLVSNIEGPMEIILNGKMGYCFVKGDFIDLKQKIEIIIQNYESKNAIVNTENAYKHALHNYNIEKTSFEYYLQYKKI